MSSLLKSLNTCQIFSNIIKRSIESTVIPRRDCSHKIPKPRLRHPGWLPKTHRVIYNEELTQENKDFVKEVIETKYGNLDCTPGMQTPLKIDLPEPVTKWTPGSMRTGLIAKKIGIYPMWLKNGKKVSSTLFQIVDNEIVKYMPPAEYNAYVVRKPPQIRKKKGCLLVGAESTDPQLLTKEYYRIFADAGVTPKKILRRFFVTEDAVLQSGTPLYAAHFKPGQVIDIRAKTVDRGFQGVMKRWGFKGMPASHGVTKTHRRPGNIGSGGKLARVMPGTKMPGHMGNRWRTHRGIRILRINTKYNVIWVLGQNIPGETNTVCYLYDTVLPRRKAPEIEYFPTYMPGINAESLPEDLYADDVHKFGDPTIEFQASS